MTSTPLAEGTPDTPARRWSDKAPANGGHDGQPTGLIRPVRETYMHKTCLGATTISRATAETIARDPALFRDAYCAICGEHFQVSEFLWTGTTIKVGT